MINTPSYPPPTAQSPKPTDPNLKLKIKYLERHVAQLQDELNMGSTNEPTHAQYTPRHPQHQADAMYDIQNGMVQRKPINQPQLNYPQAPNSLGNKGGLYIPPKTQAAHYSDPQRERKPRPAAIPIKPPPGTPRKHAIPIKPPPEMQSDSSVDANMNSGSVSPQEGLNKQATPNPKRPNAIPIKPPSGV